MKKKEKDAVCSIIGIVTILLLLVDWFKADIMNATCNIICIVYIIFAILYLTGNISTKQIQVPPK